ncbi:MAG: hypothetical protein U0929_16515 [Planctomycetaceae bacterium]
METKKDHFTTIVMSILAIVVVYIFLTINTAQAPAPKEPELQKPKQEIKKHHRRA